MATEVEKRRCLQYSGEEDDFAYWSEKFEGYMHTKNLRGQLLGTDKPKDDEKYIIWAELVQCLDKRSLMILKSECKGIWPEAKEWLRAQFCSSETPRVMNLLEQLMSVVEAKHEDGRLTDLNRESFIFIRSTWGEVLRKVVCFRYS